MAELLQLAAYECRRLLQAAVPDRFVVRDRCLGWLTKRPWPMPVSSRQARGWRTSWRSWTRSAAVDDAGGSAAVLARCPVKQRELIAPSWTSAKRELGWQRAFFHIAYICGAATNPDSSRWECPSGVLQSETRTDTLPRYARAVAAFNTCVMTALSTASHVQLNLSPT